MNTYLFRSFSKGNICSVAIIVVCLVAMVGCSKGKTDTAVAKQPELVRVELLHKQIINRDM